MLKVLLVFGAYCMKSSQPQNFAVSSFTVEFSEGLWHFINRSLLGMLKVSLHHWSQVLAELLCFFIMHVSCITSGCCVHQSHYLWPICILCQCWKLCFGRCNLPRTVTSVYCHYKNHHTLQCKMNGTENVFISLLACVGIGVRFVRDSVYVCVCESEREREGGGG